MSFSPDDNMIKKVRAEKAEFEAENTLEGDKIQNELLSKEQLISVNNIAHKAVLQLFKDYYAPQILEHMQIDPSRITLLASSLRSLSKNNLKVCGPLTCLGPKCYANARCPIQSAGVAPIGHPCCIELMLIDQWEDEYLNDLNVDKQSKIELDMIRDMIEADLIDWRASHELANSGLFDWNAIGMTDAGKPIYRKEEAVAIGIKLKFKARKDKLREDLMATRKVKAKFGLSKTLDPSKMAAALNDRYRSIKDAQVEDDDGEEMNDRE